MSLTTLLNRKSAMVSYNNSNSNVTSEHEIIQLYDKISQLITQAEEQCKFEVVIRPEDWNIKNDYREICNILMDLFREDGYQVEKTYLSTREINMASTELYVISWRSPVALKYVVGSDKYKQAEREFKKLI